MPISAPGHGRCYTLAPDLLECDDEGFVTLLGQSMDVPDGQRGGGQGRRRRFARSKPRARRRLNGLDASRHDSTRLNRAPSPPRGVGVDPQSSVADVP
jgi:hypothetical protein